MTPTLADCINEWRKNTSYSDWSFTESIGRAIPSPAGYLHSPWHGAQGLVQVWSDHVIVIIEEDTISAFQASEHYRKYIKKMRPPGSNQWIRIEAADPEFFDILGKSMEIINGNGKERRS